MRPRLRPSRRAAASAALFVAALAAPSVAQERASTAPAPEAPSAAAKAEAESHFERGLRMYKAEAWEPAAAEFLESRRLYPTWGATSSAARCLQKLGREVEALDLFEALLAEFGDVLPTEAKEAALSEAEHLRDRVGEIAIDGGAKGAAVVVDGQRRAELPLAAALRVGAGAHVVRIEKDGFEPFEARVEVAGRQTTRVAARLAAIETRARLRISEKAGMRLDVELDGVRVGKTPWEGTVEPGSHLIMLHGPDRLATNLRTVSVKAGQVAELSLAAVRQPRVFTSADPIVLDYDKGAPIPPGYRLDTSMRKGLIVAGGTIFGCTYALTSVNSLLGDVNINVIPAVGPLIYATQARVAPGFFVLNGIVQLSGLMMLASGVLFPKATLVREDFVVARTGPRLLGAAPARLGRDGLGLQVSGAF